MLERRISFYLINVPIKNCIVQEKHYFKLQFNIVRTIFTYIYVHIHTYSVLLVGMLNIVGTIYISITSRTNSFTMVNY